MHNVIPLMEDYKKTEKKLDQKKIHNNSPLKVVMAG